MAATSCKGARANIGLKRIFALAPLFMFASGPGKARAAASITPLLGADHQAGGLHVGHAFDLAREAGGLVDLRL